MVFNKKLILAILYLLFSGVAFAENIKIAFIVDQRVLVNHPAAEATIKSWLYELNTYYRDSGVNINAQLADIRFMDIGMTDAAKINKKMMRAEHPFADMRTYTDRKGADFTISVIDGLKNGGEATGGLAYINAEYDGDLSYDLAEDFVSCMNKHGFDACTSGGDFWSDTRDSFTDAFEDLADITLEFMLDTIEETCRLIGRSDCEVEITNLSEHKYFVGSVNFSHGSLVVAHELGHMMGLIHGGHVADTCGVIQNVFDDRGAGITSYAGGFAQGNCNHIDEQNEFHTIMAKSYADGFLAPIFSTKKFNSLCGVNGGICGADRADSVRALNEHLGYYNKQSTDVAELDYEDNFFKGCLANKYLDREVADFHFMDCAGQEISSVTGIKQLAYLKYLDLSENNLVNVSELLLLNPVSVQVINLYGNDNVLCHQLTQLSNMLGSSFLPPAKCLNIGAMIATTSLLLN